MTQFSKKNLGIAFLTIAIAASAGAWWVKKHKTTKPVMGEALIANPDTPFAIGSCLARLHDDKPALAVMFSQSIDPDQALDKLIEVSDLGEAKGGNDNNEGARKTSSTAAAKPTEVVKGGWILSDNPHVLLFPFVKAGHTYRVNLSGMLAASSGKKLNAPQSCELVSDEMAPSYFFASKGTVLPAGLNGGLPVVTVNIPEVDVEFLRVSPEKLPKFIDMVVGKNHQGQESEEETESEEADYYDYYGNRNKLKGLTSGWQLNALQGIAESVYQNRFVTNEVPNSRKVSFLPVEKISELKEPGIYVAVMRRPGYYDYDYQVTYFYVSDIGLHLRRQQKQTDVFTTSLKDGKAQGGVDLEVLADDGKVLLRGKTDGDGHGVLPGLPSAARLMLAKRGKETSIIVLQEPGLDLAEFDIGGHLPRDAKLFAWSGRDLYRPGERFTASLMARSAEGIALPPQPVKVTLKKPSGDLVSSTVWQPNPKTPGYLQNTIDLPPDAATGRWSLEFRADPNAKRPDSIYSFQVEEFLPERMKLSLKTDTVPLQANNQFLVAVQGDYLYGAPASGNRLLGSVAQERFKNPLSKEWPGFIFGDFADDKDKTRAELEETALDDNGKAEVSVAFNANAKSPVKVRASFSLLESGGRPIVRSLERVWWPAKAMIAIRPLFERDVAHEGSMAEFEIIRVDNNGKFVTLKQAPFKLVREDRQYYWRYDAGRGWHSGYSEAEETIHAGALELKNRAKLTVPVQWGRYRLEITDPETNLVSRYFFYAGWNAQDSESVGNRPDRVRLQLEGVPAKPGNDVTLNIIPPHDGEALILLEADKVLWSKRVSVSTNGTKVNIPIDKTWNRSDMYVSTVVFRPGSQGDKVTPARAVGLTWLPLAREARKLKVSVATPTQVEPEKRMVAKVKVENAAGKKVTVTVSAVDVGILNITGFKTPDPFDFFFGKHRFSAELTDIYGKLIERMDGTPGKIKWGGDAGKRDTKSMPKKVKLVDIFSGPVQLNEKGEADVALNIPDFNGSLRVMVVASTEDAYGSAEKEVIVSAPIVAEIATPRFIGPGDTSSFALDVTNMMPSEQNIQIKLSADKLLKIADGERNIKLSPKQRNILRFNVEPTEPFGLSRISLDVKTVGAKPILIHREFALQIQPPVPREQDARRLRIEPGATQKLDANMVERFYRGSATLSVTMSNRPPLNVRSIVKGLLDYPYGCLEQTTSAAYPHVFIDEEGAKAVGLIPHTREQRAKFIEGAISRIAGMQGAEGGFRLWNGNDGSYEMWLTPYVVSFLADAREAGFNVPEEMSKRAQKWMSDKLNSAANQFSPLPTSVKPNANGQYDWRDYDLIRNSHQRFAELAHIGYMLARDQKASLASLRLLHDSYRDRAKSPLALVHLGLALQLMGDQKRADVALNDAMSKPYGIRTDWDWDYLGDYGTAVRDQAMTYALMLRHKVTHPQREALLISLADRLSKPRGYFSTQERIALFLAARAAGGTVTDPWEVVLKTAEGSSNIISKSSESRSFEPALAVKGISLENKGTNPLWIEVEASGYPLKLPISNAEKISLERKWFTAAGKPWSGGNLKVGDMLIVRVTAKSKQVIEDAMVIDHIPAGLEVENLNISQGPQASEFNIDGINLAAAMADERIKHKEYRDDRFVAAVRLNGNPIQLFYMLRVVTPGRFHVPGTYAEDMYRPDIRAYGPSSDAVNVVDPRAGK
ncbi:alpha-2-macroglobulin family protein [Undibacterium fentianense]|uniref:Alpha-2-macroglobulin family protein n=1 Tax=Undibacterium fentianense TaxID=2828728 RepID=A0A941E6A6_9BURK|nr:alpha-2-macroglobulin [Undibacterium fentianense]MBR7801761.1 alpha-2-macroglobulin family protein [Undibacterium fentianense]